MNVRKEIEKSLEDRITKHIKLYSQRNLPTINPVYVRNQTEIYKLAEQYEKLFNECPTISIYEMSFYLRGLKK